MIDLVKNITIKVFVLSMILTMGLLTANKVIFMHSHRLPDGSVITHAHPFNKSNDNTPYKKHRHTKADFFFLHSLEWLIPLLMPYFAWLNLIGKPVKRFSWQRLQAFLSLNYNPGRAPPAF